MTHIQQKQKVFSFKISFYSENTAHDKMQRTCLEVKQ